MDVLLVDDDADLVQSLSRALASVISPLQIIAAGNVERALEFATQYRPKVAVVDLCLQEGEGVASGFELLSALLERDKALRVIVLTGHGSADNGVRAIRMGAASFLEKPVDPSHLGALIVDGARQSEIHRLCEELEGLEHSPLEARLAGTCSAMATLREQIRFAASTLQPVLLVGETGTGKGVCARLIHDLSSRAAGRFVVYQPNFGGGDLVQSELFGHVKGAFTGASESRRGLAAEADGGTLFLDELDALPTETQVKLLDLVQERRIRPVGADAFLYLDCRIVAASNRPLDELRSGTILRKDLFHRLAHCIIEIPPLRERKRDISELAFAALIRLRERDDVNVFEIEPAALTALEEYSWPGNVRELEAIVEGAAYRARFAGRSVVIVSDLGIAGASFQIGGDTLNERTEAFKAQLARETLARHGGNQLRAAKELGVDRGTLKRILERNSKS